MLSILYCPCCHKMTCLHVCYELTPCLVVSFEESRLE